MDRAPTRKAWLRPCLVPDRRSTQPLELAIRHSERQRHTGSGRRSGDCVERAVVGAVEARSAHEDEAARRRGPLVNDVPFAVGAGYLLSSQLFGVKFWDPAALAIAAGSLAVAAFIASIVPATRAAAIAPIKALRME